MAKSSVTMIVSKDGTVGANIRRLRKDRAWTQRKLAEEMQLLGSSATRDTINKAERGRNIKAEDLVAAKIALETTFEELFAGVLPIKDSDGNVD